MNYNYLSIDCESTGLDTANDQVLELAVVLDDLSQKVNREDLEDYLKQLPVFHCYIKHSRILGNVYAISMHNRIFNIIAKEPAIEYFEDMKPGSVLLPEQVYQYLGVFLRDYG